MLKINEFETGPDLEKQLDRGELVDFLHAHLDQFGDSKKAIGNAISYALDGEPGTGGFVLTAHEDDNMIGALVMNDTGMSGYIPEHVLVYVAVDASCRGKGYGGQICRHALNKADGNVKLHVEYDNPAKRLYERLGFTNKYAEMRWSAD